jgi:phosphonate transport system substrate-binding protein
VKVVYTTPDFYDYNWTVRGDLDPALREKIKQAFLALDATKPEHKAILELQRASRFVETNADNYRRIEEAAKQARLFDGTAP